MCTLQQNCSCQGQPWPSSCCSQWTTFPLILPSQSTAVDTDQESLSLKKVFFFFTRLRISWAPGYPSSHLPSQHPLMAYYHLHELNSGVFQKAGFGHLFVVNKGTLSVISFSFSAVDMLTNSQMDHCSLGSFSQLYPTPNSRSIPPWHCK